MAQEKTFSIHQGKKSLVDRYLHARKSLKRNLQDTTHRLEVCGEIDGIGFINDARSDGLLATRDSFKCIDKPIVWIAHAPLHDRDCNLIEKYLKYKIKSLVVVGVNALPFANQIAHLVERAKTTSNVEDALSKAHALAAAGDVVLYSPGCMNVDNPDEFLKNGNRFKNWVNELNHQE